MIPHNLLTALPFWDKKEKQTFRQPYCKGPIGAIQCRYDRMLPFTLKHNPETAPNFVRLVSVNPSSPGGTINAINLHTLITVLTTTADDADGDSNGYIYHEGSLDINPATTVNEYNSDQSDNPDTWDSVGTTTWADFVCDGGYYYIEISVGSSRYYSELIQISDFDEQGTTPDNMNKTRLRIEGTNLCPVGELAATLNVNKLFVDSYTSEPEYSITKEVAKDGQAEETPVWVKYKKRYVARFHAIETVIDWLHSLVLYGDNVSVTDQYGYQASISDIGIQVSWPTEFDGCVGLVEFSYSITYLSQTGCC